jgi:Flp pilus assembly protein TadB
VCPLVRTSNEGAEEMTSEDEEINEELHELWLEDYENWKRIKRENRKKSVKKFWALFGKYAIVLTVGIYIGIISQLHLSILLIVFYILAIGLCSFLFVFIFHHSDRELRPETLPSPIKYIWENGELKVENPEE